MGLKKFFTKKTPSEEEVEAKMEEQLTNKNIPTRRNRNENVKNKHDLFKAYGSYANDRTQEKVFAPAGYESQSNQFRPNTESGEDANNSNYDSNELNNEQNPYASTSNSNSTSTRTNTSNSSTNPYASSSNNNNNANPYSSSNNPYGSASSNPYDQSHSASSYGKGAPAAPSYSSQPGSRPQVQSSASSMARQTLNSYARRGVDGSPITSDPYLANKTAVENDSYDLNADRDAESIVQPQQQQLQRSNTKQTTYTYNDYDLNADVVQEEYQPQLQEQELTEEQRAQMEEDEEVEGIKTDIRFLKQESVASTRNTLRMARQAEESGKNTMGMLGHQSESLYQTEKLLSLSETQERIAKEKIGDIEHYRRHILKPGMKNPFTKGKRLREREDRIKNEYLADRMEAEEQRLTVTESENRVKAAILNQESKREPTTSDRYRRDKILSQARRYQFEADEEDDAMELEIGENISEIDKIAGRLKNLAMDQSKEIEAQNERLGNIEERTQKLDVKLRINTDRLARQK